MGPVGVFVAFAAASAVAGYQASKKQAAASKEISAAQRKQAETQQKIADIRARRERLATIRKARVARLTTEAQAARGGGLEGSAFQGFAGSVTSQAAGSVGTSIQTSGLAREQTIFNIAASERAQNYMDSASNWAGMQTIFSAGASIAGTQIPTSSPTSTKPIV